MTSMIEVFLIYMIGVLVGLTYSTSEDRRRYKEDIQKEYLKLLI